MQNALDRFYRSPTSKVLGIGVLILILLLPVAMIRDTVRNRSATAMQASADIMRTWGARQTVTSPVLVVPYDKVEVDPLGEPRESSGELFILPATLVIDAELVPEIRYRGLHEVPVYTATNRISGTFAAPDTGGLGIDQAVFHWERAYFLLPVSDARAIRNAPEIVIGDTSTRFGPGGTGVPGLGPEIVAPAVPLFDPAAQAAAFDFEVRLDIAGTERLAFLPLGDATRVSLRSGWPSPSFSGAYLPERREVDESGFSAEWRVSNLGRSLPSRFVRERAARVDQDLTAFGVDLYVPVALYQLTDRATKYAILFIGLTFVAYFLFEVLAKVRLHPLQYLLVGFANALFYLLLLSLAEHIGFAGAYLLSAVASIALIAAYSSAVLGSRRRGVLISAMLAVLYGLLYLTLSAENYAMLAGAVSLWAVLGLVMYLTRRIDWYRWNRDGESDQAELFAGRRT